MCYVLLPVPYDRKGKEAWKNGMILLKLLYDEASRDSKENLHDQKWLYKGFLDHNNQVNANETSLVRPCSPIRRLLLALCIDQMLEVALSVTSTRDEILERKLQATLPKGTLTSHLDQSQEIYTYLLMRKLFYEHHDFIPCLHIEHTTVRRLQ